MRPLGNGMGVGKQDKSRKINSLGPHLGGRELCNVLKYRTCSLGDGDAFKVSQKKSDAVRAKLKKTSLRIVQKKKLFKWPRKKPQGSKQQK